MEQGGRVVAVHGVERGVARREHGDRPDNDEYQQGRVAGNGSREATSNRERCGHDDIGVRYARSPGGRLGTSDGRPTAVEGRKLPALTAEYRQI